MLLIPTTVKLNNFLFFGLKSSHSVQLEQLYDRELKTFLFKSETITNSDLYMICRVKKLRILIDFTFILSGTLFLSLEVSRRKRFFSLRLSKVFGTTHVKIDRQYSTNKKLCLLVGGERFFFRIEDIEKIFNLKTNNPPEILYIGESQKMESRTVKHENIGPCQAVLRDDEELRFQFLIVNYEYGYSKNNSFNYVPLSLQDHLYIPGMDFSNFNRSKVQIAERLLINYYRPEININHKGDNFFKNKILTKARVELDIDHILFGTAMNGNSFQFWSSEQRLKHSDFAYNFKVGNSGYSELNLDTWMDEFFSQQKSIKGK